MVAFVRPTALPCRNPLRFLQEHTLTASVGICLRVSKAGRLSLETAKPAGADIPAGFVSRCQRPSWTPRQAGVVMPGSRGCDVRSADAAAVRGLTPAPVTETDGRSARST
jgi:hypothetical protein